MTGAELVPSPTKTPEWKDKRSEIYARNDYRCVDCSKIGVTIHCHHIHYVKGMKPWEYGGLRLPAPSCCSNWPLLDRFIRARPLRNPPPVTPPPRASLVLRPAGGLDFPGLLPAVGSEVEQM